MDDLSTTEATSAEQSEGYMVTTWNKDQAELLRRIALAGGSFDANECQGEDLDALIAAGFVTEQVANRIALTDAGLARAEELRLAGVHDGAAQHDRRRLK